MNKETDSQRDGNDQRFNAVISAYAVLINHLIAKGTIDPESVSKDLLTSKKWFADEPVTAAYLEAFAKIVQQAPRNGP